MITRKLNLMKVLLWSVVLCIAQPQTSCTTSFNSVDGGTDADRDDGAVWDALAKDASADAEVFCGNDLIEGDEECDGANLDGETCQSMGFPLGDLACRSCSFDLSDCNNNCGGVNQPACPAGFPEDDFDDGIRASLWSSSYAFGSSSYEETNGHLNITLPPTGTGYAGYYTNTTFDLRDSEITIEILEIPNQCCDGADMQLSLVNSVNEEWAGISLSAGVLRGFYNIGGTFSAFSPTSYDAQLHRFWRLRESAGTFYVDTSPDGANWQNLGAMDNPIPMDLIYIDINAGCWDPVTDPGVAVFDNFNILP